MKVGDTLIKKSQNLRKTLSSLSALCKCIYERLFNFILARCNEALDRSFSRKFHINLNLPLGSYPLTKNLRLKKVPHY
uniref:Uncharacterized protein n=1 Tax=Parascaris equorum TaxID=6256 RepID=A0A914RSB7_PAREQ